ncbi:MAG: hypothetical protein AB7K24_19405 [Gemmataceae bacterium]
MKRRHIALVYNSYQTGLEESEEDRGSNADLRTMIRYMARVLRRSGHQVTLLPLGNDLFAFQRKLRRVQPDVIFNQYDDVVLGAFHEIRFAALMRMMGFPITGSAELSLGLCRFKYVTSCLLAGMGVPVPPQTCLVDSLRMVEQKEWEYPLIVQPSQEHAGIGTDRDSLVTSKQGLRKKVREILKAYNQPAVVQQFCPGREFNVGILGASKMRVLPLAEMDYSQLPPHVPPIMSYAAKWLESTDEYECIDVTCPAEVEPGLARAIEEVALSAFRAVGGRGYGRVDIRLDEQGQPRVLDVNCNPCLDDEMGLARSAAAAGISYPELLDQIIECAFEPNPYEVELPIFQKLPAQLAGV